LKGGGKSPTIPPRRVAVSGVRGRRAMTISVAAIAKIREAAGTCPSPKTLLS
jgi:hypothetical protein